MWHARFNALEAKIDTGFKNLETIFLAKMEQRLMSGLDDEKAATAANTAALTAFTGAVNSAIAEMNSLLAQNTALQAELVAAANGDSDADVAALATTLNANNASLNNLTSTLQGAVTAAVQATPPASPSGTATATTAQPAPVVPAPATPVTPPPPSPAPDSAPPATDLNTGPTPASSDFHTLD